MSDLLEYLHSTGRFERLREYEGRRGVQVTASCPFAEKTHQRGTDRNPSWAINAETGLWRCLACGEHGDLADLIGRLGLPGILAADGLLVEPDVSTQIENLRKRLGITEPSEKTPDYWPLPRMFQRFRKHEISPSRMYLKDIGIVRRSIERFGIGYLSAPFYVEEKLVGDTHDIVYPIWDAEGFQLAWQVRRRSPDAPTRFQFPSGFQKANYLYNLHEFPQPDDVIIVEGIKAVVKLSQYGIRSVSCFSDTLSVTQISLLAKMKSITLMFDGDLAGQRGMHGYYDERKRYVPGALQLLKAHYPGLIYWAVLPDKGKESSPDDFPLHIIEACLAQRKKMRTSDIPRWESIRSRFKD